MNNIFNLPVRIDFRDPRTGKTTSRAWREWFQQNEENINKNTQFISVTDITDPSSELSVIKGTKDGEILVAYQNVSSGDYHTIYTCDTQTTLTADVPYIVEGDLCFWIASGGCYTRVSDKWRHGIDGDDYVIQVSNDGGTTWTDTTKFVYADYP